MVPVLQSRVHGKMKAPARWSRPSITTMKFMSAPFKSMRVLELALFLERGRAPIEQET